MRTVLGYVVLGALATAWPAPGNQTFDAAALSGNTPRYVAMPDVREFSGELIARPIQHEEWTKRGLADAQAQQQAQLATTALSAYARIDYVPETDEYIIEVPAGKDENAVADELLATGLFQYVEPNWIVYPVACPNDPLLGNQWHHAASRMQSCDAWGLHTGNPTVGVGICDTGVLTTHQDLLLNRRQAYNAVDQLWESQGGAIGPIHPHGTQTTGCAAANGNNGVGISGTGWNLGHRMLRVSNSTGGGSSLAVLQHAARKSIESGDKVASVSYSGVDSSSNLTTATYIKNLGGMLVWAAGNENRNLTLGDRDADDIIVVAATDSNDAKASFSNYGIFVDVAAPGVSVYTTTSSSNSAYTAVSGTSFACPLTAGLVGLIWSANPTLTHDQVEAVLKQGCKDLGAAGVDNIFGHGRINSYNSLVLAGGGGGITDCNGNGVDDATDIANGTSQDCNTNGVPDECDIADGTSQDANGNGVPDECDPPPPASGVLWMVFENSVTLPGLGTVAPQDIVSYDESTGTWALVFDGSDVGLSSLAIDGLARMSDGSLLLSFTVAATIPGVSGTVDDSDIVRFVPTSLGANTAGAFSWYFDGSDVGLTTNDEDVDAIGLTSDGRLVLSTLGSFSVSGVSGTDADLIVFNATSLGANTAGTFQMYFDASDVGLSTTNEDVDAACILPNGDILLSTIGNFSVPGVSGQDEDILRFTPTSLGTNTAGTFAMRLDLSSLGITTDVRAVAFVE